MSEKIETEKKWLSSVVVPHMLKTGFLDQFDDKTNSQNKVSLNDLCVKSIEIKFIETDEAFMLTICYRATIEYELKGQPDKRKLVVKKTPNLPQNIFDQVNFGALFNNEIVAYTKITPAIKNFTKKTFEVPRFIYSELQRNSAAMILEDFAVNGWRLTKNKYNLSLEHTITAVKYLGEFHGIGFAMRDIKRKEFDESTSAIRESRYGNEIPDEWLLSMKQAVKRLVRTTRQYEPSVDDNFLGKIEELLDDPIAFSKQCVAPKEPFVTLCHGDFLRNNIAFRYTLKDGVEIPTAAMMFDLQTMRISSPMADFIVFLMLSVFAEVRQKNFELIFNSYRENLIDSYEKYAKKTAPAIFSYDSLLMEYIRFMPFGMHIAAFFLMNLVEPPDVAVERFLLDRRTHDGIMEDFMKRGGEVIDRELSHQMKEMYELTKKYGVDIAKDIKVCQLE